MKSEIIRHNLPEGQLITKQQGMSLHSIVYVPYHMEITTIKYLIMTICCQYISPKGSVLSVAHISVVPNRKETRRQCHSLNVEKYTMDPLAFQVD